MIPKRLFRKCDCCNEGLDKDKWETGHYFYAIEMPEDHNKKSDDDLPPNVFDEDTVRFMLGTIRDFKRKDIKSRKKRYKK